MASAPLACQRDAFTLPPDLHYLNCAYIGPLPKATEAAVEEGLRRKRVPTRIEPRHFFEDAEEARRRFARLVGGQPERVALLPSASYGIAICARNLPVEPGQNVVLTHEQFPGNVYAWRRVAEERGAELRTVAPPDAPGRGAAWNARLLEAIDDATAVVALPHVHWTDGTRFDLAAVGVRAREAGAAVVVDATQSVGALPLDVAILAPDALVCACYKWLLGPYATAVAYLGPRFDGGVPIEETWMGREGSEDFQHLVDYRDEYQPGARRYDVGEVANFALLPGVVTSLGLLLEWGPQRIQDYTRALTAELLRVARERGFHVEDEAWRGSHLFGVRMRPDVELGALKRELDRAGVAASLRGTALRVSPNVYNDRSDVAALTEVLAGV
ncbi:MAG TPA: aminotransferase class V-fold PLP-dependent enzyme [Candidatus Thermoplasmatota archaeon]